MHRQNSDIMPKTPSDTKRLLSVRGRLINRNDLYSFACVEMVITPALLPVSLECRLSISMTALRVGNMKISYHDIYCVAVRFSFFFLFLNRIAVSFVLVQH